jgi:hypothetical protein
VHVASGSSGLEVQSHTLALLQYYRVAVDADTCLHTLMHNFNNVHQGLRSSLREDSVAWAGLQATVDGAAKLVRLMFVGSEIGGMKKGKVRKFLLW